MDWEHFRRTAPQWYIDRISEADRQIKRGQVRRARLDGLLLHRHEEWVLRRAEKIRIRRSLVS